MRDTFSQCLIQFAKKNQQVLLLTGDHGYALFDEFRKVCPKQYINAGIAEQNMIGIAAGLAKTGFIPIVYGLSAFVPIRVLEQIKIDLCYENLQTILIGDGAGIVYSALGTSHQSTEDISALRAIPNIAIFSPADKYEMQACFEIACKQNSTTYIRVSKSDLGSVHENIPHIKLGEALVLKQCLSPDICFIATGSMVKTALNLAQAHDKSSVLSMPCLKPINQNQILSLICNVQRIITLEEHSIYGGLGSIISELICEFNLKIPVQRVGINDKFSKLCGSYQYLLTEHELDFVSLSSRLKF